MGAAPLPRRTRRGTPEPMRCTSGGPRRLRAKRIRVLTTLGLALALLGTGAGSRTAFAARSVQRLTLYSVAEQEQFMNNSGGRLAGVGKNPFGNFSDVTPTSKNAVGPFPGDEALFSFNLYATTALRPRVGSAVFTCQYNFDKNAFCDASFRLNNGSTLIAEGAFNFNTSKFTLAVTGGYGAFANRMGVLEETPSSSHVQRLSFQLG